MNKKIIILVIIITAAITIYFTNPQLIGKVTEVQQESISEETQPVVITQENFPVYLQQQQIIQELPKKAILSLRLYNFDTGERKWVADYTIEKGAVSEGIPENSDAEIIIHSKYAGKLINNFCQTIQQAKANGDVAFELKSDKLSLSWKYRSLMKYKDCFT